MSVMLPVFTISIFHEFCILDERKGGRKPRSHAYCPMGGHWPGQGGQKRPELVPNDIP